MRFSYFVTFQDNDNPEARISETDFQKIKQIVVETPHLVEAKLYTPETAKDYYTDDGPSPQFTMQLYFEELPQLEAVIAKDGHLQALAEPGALPSLAGARITHQVMLTRPFPVLEPVPNLYETRVPCSFLVHYPGRAENFNEWLTYYLAHHPQIMKYFPGIREIEIFTRVDWCDAMPWERVHYMQRNKVVFDGPEALTAALHSPVRHDMRADFEKFPPFEGSNIHYPMATYVVKPANSGA